MPKLGEDPETRLTVAALAAAIVRGAECEVPGLSRRVVSELDLLQHEMRYWDSEPTGALETLRWARKLIDGRFGTP